MVKACKHCKAIIKKGNECHFCKSKDLGSNVKGQIVIFDPKRSKIAKQINANSPGEYAVRVK